MANVQILPTSDLYGELGRGASSGLQNLLSGKLDQMQKQKKQQQLYDQLTGGGYGASEAQLASHLIPHLEKNPKSVLAFLQALGLNGNSGMGGQGQSAQGAQQGIAQAGAGQLTPAQLLGQTGSNKQREAQLLRQQSIINGENKKFNDTLSPQITNAEKLMDYINAARKTLGTNKTAGALRSTLPWSKLTQTEETQELENIYNNIVGLMNEGQRGIPTRYKIEFNKSLKPIVGEPRKVALKKLERLQKEAEKVLQIGQLRDQLLAENEYKQPQGLEAKIHELMKQGGEKKKSINEPTLNNQQNSSGITPENNQVGPENTPENDQIPDEESWPAWAARNAYRTLPTGLASVLTPANSVIEKLEQSGLSYSDLEKLGVTKKLSPEVRKALKEKEQARESSSGQGYEGIMKGIQNFETEKLGLPQGYSNPQGTGEELLNRFQQKLPFILSQGLAGLGGSLAAGAGSSAGEHVADSLGLGPLGQVAGGLIGGIGTSALTKGIRPKNIRENVIPKEQSKYYAHADRRASKIKQPAKVLYDFLVKEIDKLESGKSHLSDKNAKQVRHEFIKVANDIKKGEINVLDAIKSKRHLNALFKEHQGTETGNYLKRGVGALNDIIQEAGKENPHFGKIWNAAEDLTKAKHIKPDSFVEFFEDSASFKNVLKNPSLKKALSYGVLKLPVAAKKSFDTFWKHPTTQRLARKILEASVKENKGQMMNLLTRLNNLSR